MQNTDNWLTIESIESGHHELLTSACFGPRAVLFARLNNGHFSVGLADCDNGKVTRITRSISLRGYEIQGLLGALQEAARLFHEAGQ
jgi:hypothetical protein